MALINVDPLQSSANAILSETHQEDPIMTAAVCEFADTTEHLKGVEMGPDFLIALGQGIKETQKALEEEYGWYSIAEGMGTPKSILAAVIQGIERIKGQQSAKETAV